MAFQTILLYLSTIAIWGSTWLVITFQLGSVDPIISVIYRMAIASFALFCYCRWRGIKLRASRQDQYFFLIQGILSFGINFWCIYLSELYLTSGIIAVIFSLIVFFNIVNGRIFLGRPIERNTIFGGLIGLSGLTLLFYPELTRVNDNEQAIKGLILALIAVTSASLGNMAATRSGLRGLSVWQINAWSTAYGAIALVVIALATGSKFTFEPSFEYVSSLLYLSLFGTIFAFGAYLKLMVEIGPEKASYGALLIPFVAIMLSTLFEGYQWTIIAVIGFAAALAGNYLVMRQP